MEEVLETNFICNDFVTANDEKAPRICNLDGPNTYKKHTKFDKGTTNEEAENIGSSTRTLQTTANNKKPLRVSFDEQQNEINYFSCFSDEELSQSSENLGQEGIDHIINSKNDFRQTKKFAERECHEGENKNVNTVEKGRDWNNNRCAKDPDVTDDIGIVFNDSPSSTTSSLKGIPTIDLLDNLAYSSASSLLKNNMKSNKSPDTSMENLAIKTAPEGSTKGGGNNDTTPSMKASLMFSNQGKDRFPSFELLSLGSRGGIVRTTPNVTRASSRKNRTSFSTSVANTKPLFNESSKDEWMAYD